MQEDKGILWTEGSDMSDVPELLENWLKELRKTIPRKQELPPVSPAMAAILKKEFPDIQCKTFLTGLREELHKHDCDA
jgi:hypothetical protein